MGQVNDGEKLVGHITRLAKVKPRFSRISGPKERPMLSVAIFEDGPLAPLLGMTTGLSLYQTAATGPERCELLIAVDSRDPAWAYALGEVAYRLRSACAFEPGDLINFKARISRESAMSAFVVAEPAILPDEKQRLPLSAFEVVFRELIPLYPGEHQEGLRLGGAALLEKLRAQKGWDPRNTRRADLSHGG